MTQALWVLCLLLLAAGYIAAPSGPVLAAGLAALGALQQLFGLRQRLRQRRATAAADAAQAHTARRTGAPGWQQQLHAVATELQQRHVIALLRRLGDELRGVAFGQRQPALRAH